ncbi:camk protein kinase [Phytophthora cinnamomi]|uniref:camk protein kinase n=1 Tax=Phytophthora cinnamomi TaxID=4785 RepID=UPI00355A1F00|nr:camk protein kinase [Phytophthora cinnamomi]
MLKRGSSRSSRRGRPADSLSERDSGSRSRSPSPAAPRRKTRKSRSRDSSDDDKKERLKKAGRMKRAPLLDYSIVEAVYSAMVGQAQRRASRHWLQQFAKYEEAKRPGVIKADKFTRCLSRMGIELDKREHYEALADCFKSSGGSGGDSDGSGNNKRKSTTQLVDYIAFVDFACNVRDSEKLSEIADSLRDSISKYDGKKQSSTSYNLAAGLEKMDRHKRGWITSTQFERALLREDQGPSFRLSASQVSTLVDRFEYEYEKQQLGIDYMQFAQWLQPLLHLDVEMVHERVKSLIKDAGEKEGWELEEIFRAMDDDKNGEIDAVELKEALLEMGLPLTDAQIRCLADDYARSAYDDNTDEEHNGGVANELSNNDDCEGGEEWSRSDDEYHKHLKRSLKRAFDFFDLDQTSTIDKRELSHVLRALGHEFTSKELEAEMANADLDRNGQLDFYEFVAFVKKQLAEKTYLLSQQREMEIRQSFQSLDTDKNGALDEQEFEYLIYKVLQVELSVEEQDALLDFVDKDADGLISEDEFIVFMKKLETLHRKYSGKGGWRKQKQFLDSLDTTSQLAYSAMKKLVRGAPMDLDRNLLMFFGIPSNFRPAISSAATCRTLHGNTMEHVLSFPSPQTIEALALDTRLSDKKDSSWFALSRLDTNSDEYRMLQQAEGVEAQAIVSLKRAAGVPKPFDTREDDVVKRCVHVCLFQEQQEVSGSKGAVARRRRTAAAKNPKIARAGSVVGNVHEIPVYWHQGEEDVWEFSKKSTKQDKYKFLVRTNAVNDHLYLLVEFIVHLKLTPEEDQSNKRSKRRTARKEQNDSGDELGADGGTREMVCCWCKIPVRQLLAKRSDILRRKEKLWGGTANAPVDIEQDELLRRRTGWRAFTNMFTKPSPPLMGIKSVPVDSLAEDLQLFVRKMPPIVIAPFVSLPILAEYMALVRKTLAHVTSSSSVMTCEPVLKLLPKIVDDHVALSIFRKAFDSEVAGMKPGEERQMKFQQLVLRMWPSFVHWQEHLPPSLLPQVKLPGAVQTSKAPAGVPPKGVTTTSNTAAIVNDQVAAQMRLNLLQTTASGKLRLQDVRVTSTPFHVREVAFRRLL